MTGGREVDHRQPRMADGDSSRRIDPGSIAVRAAMGQRLGHFRNALRNLGLGAAATDFEDTRKTAHQRTRLGEALWNGAQIPQLWRGLVYLIRR